MLAAYLFAKRFLAEATDGHLSPAEASWITADAARHAEALGHPPQAVQQAVDRAGATYDALLVGGGPIAVVRHFRDCVAALGELDAATRSALLAEMERLARADGRVTDMEQHFLDEVGRTWLVRAARDGTRSEGGGRDLQPYVIAQMYLARASGGVGDAGVRSIRRSLGNLARRHGIDDAPLESMVEAARQAHDDAHARGGDALHRLFLASLASVRGQWSDDPATLHAMADAMLHLASSDGTVDDLEAALLQDIAASWQAGTDPV